MRFNQWLIIASSFIMVWTTFQANAHPHVWIDAQSELVFDSQNRISSVQHSWKFDEAFTAFAIYGLDEDEDGVYSKEELQPLAEVNVTSLLEFDYFTFLTVGESLVAFAEPEKYWLEYSDGTLTLNYTLPLQVPILMDDQDANLKVFDPTYFVAIEMLETDPFLLVNAGETCGMEIERPQELGSDTLSALASIPMTERDVPTQLMQITSTLSNTAIVSCS